MRTLRLVSTAMAVLALAVGTTGAAVVQADATEDVGPAAVSEPPAPSFPTGTFVSVETGRVMLEFLGDGRGRTHSATYDSITPITYVVDGDIYTALRGPWDSVLGVALVDEGLPSGWATATYRWDHDGERLAFELLGEDRSDRRKSLLGNHTFRSIDDPRVVMTASSDLDVGDPIRAWLAFVSAAEAGPDAYTSKTEYLGSVAAVPISKGKPIAPDVVTPAE